MSAYAPNFQQQAPVQRHPEQWQPAPAQSYHAAGSHSHSNGSAVGEKVSSFFGADRRDELPMYKDKPNRGKGPYGYPSGGRKQPWYRRRRTVVTLLGSIAILNWWFGILSPFAYFIGDGVRRTSTATGWEARAEEVKDVFKISFSGYEKNAWGYDEYHPVSKRGRQMTPTGLGWIIVDALDTMMLMNLTTELSHAREWIHNNLTYDQDHDVNTFETTIRMLGGLLSAHYLSTEIDGVYAPVDDAFGDDLYIEKATDLAERLLGAYATSSGVPLASVNLHSMKGIPSHADGGASSTAEATSLQLEMKYLAKLTGEDHFWDKAEHVMKVVDDNNPKDGLVPIFIHADKGTFRGENIRLGSRGDSYYEYLIKQYLQTSGQEPVYRSMWEEALAGMKKWLITYSYPSNFTVIAERPTGLEGKISPKMDHLVCFVPGTLALATTGGLPLAQAKAHPNWDAAHEEDMRLAEELMNTCYGMYVATSAGLAGEITHFNIHSPPLMYNAFLGKPESRPHSPAKFEVITPGHDFVGRDDYNIKPGDAHNLQRPETIESLFYMWRITGNDKYREWGWDMFQNFVKWTEVDDHTGFSSLSSVLKTPPPLRDNMESFWLAETLKYFYLLFSPNNILPLSDIVFNTEAHPFPRFQMGKLFTTGWQRKHRDVQGNIIPDDALTVTTMTEGAETQVKTIVQTQQTTQTTIVEGADATPPPEQMPVLDPVTGETTKKEEEAMDRLVG